ncbi:MAG: transcriptional regulator [Rhodocyclaceae bacterium]|nr:transcriptional regulator [Rhodocyclaceae bacterium]MBK6555382.1 transcriptional regulator [Rhodocyclaceae bacterium]MBK6676710.1 transcriptional regulator [Rhodocyclaceae bacterium]MBK9309335.1 transcriptional regulator [Rhodocyclaceae bacterium]MBK9955571.1 transcriptional regulator [Rhodocyclaceae bacterium]
MTQLFHKGSAELLADLASKVTHLLVSKAALTEGDADLIGIEVAEAIAQDWGGQVTYIPKNFIFEVNRKHLEIYGKFNGRNHGELAAEYRIAVQTVYKIVARIKARLVADRQPDMFSEAGDLN